MQAANGHIDGSAADANYAVIGSSYSEYRQPDPAITGNIAGPRDARGDNCRRRQARRGWTPLESLFVRGGVDRVGTRRESMTVETWRGEQPTAPLRTRRFPSHGARALGLFGAVAFHCLLSVALVFGPGGQGRRATLPPTDGTAKPLVLLQPVDEPNLPPLSLVPAIDRTSGITVSPQTLYSANFRVLRRISRPESGTEY